MAGFEIQSFSMKPNESKTFSFKGNVTSFAVMVQHWKFVFKKDHHVQVIQIKLGTTTPNSNEITVKADCILQDTDKHYMEYDDSFIRVLVLAWTGTELESDAAILRTVKNVSREAQTQQQKPGYYLGTTNMAPTPSSGTALAGYKIQFEDNKDHQLIRVMIDSSLNYVSGDLYAVVDYDMHDTSKTAHYSEATVDVGVLAQFRTDLGLCAKHFTVHNNDDGWVDMSTQIPAGYVLQKAYPVVSGFNAEYSDQHYIKMFAVGSGTDGDGSIAIKGGKVQIETNGIAHLNDDGTFVPSQENDTKSYCEVMVIGLLAKS